jgi:hypothetical protein
MKGVKRVKKITFVCGGWKYTRIGNGLWRCTKRPPRQLRLKGT